MVGSSSFRNLSRLLGGVVAGLAAITPASASAAVATYTVGPVNELSASCSGPNAEIEQAADRNLGYVYETWMGCRGIAFARSVDGGRSFEEPITVPGSVGSNRNSWDPAVTVAPDGTVYAAFMISRSSQWYPVVATSFDHGVTFPQVSSLTPPDAKNWGDRDFIAVGPDGTVYVTWDYGPDRTSVTFVCASNGSCGFSTGDVNVVMQKSTDRGATWGAMTYVSPGFPNSGGDSGPMVIEPASPSQPHGRIDVLYQGYGITNPPADNMSPAYSYFTSSDDQGATWSAPVAVGASGGTMSVWEWWIDGSIGLDAGGNLYAAWDTQGTNPDGSANDVGWVAFSTNHGRTWSAPIQGPADRLNFPHIMEVAGGPSGVAYVSWLSDANPLGYTQYLQAFSVTKGWLSTNPAQVSSQYGDPSVWPGDTTGISTLSPGQVVLSWGSATPATGKQSQVWAAPVTVAIG